MMKRKGVSGSLPLGRIRSSTLSFSVSSAVKCQCKRTQVHGLRLSSLDLWDSLGRRTVDWHRQYSIRLRWLAQLFRCHRYFKTLQHPLFTVKDTPRFRKRIYLDSVFLITRPWNGTLLFNFIWTSPDYLESRICNWFQVEYSRKNCKLKKN